MFEISLAKFACETGVLDNNRHVPGAQGTKTEIGEGNTHSMFHLRDQETGI